MPEWYGFIIQRSIKTALPCLSGGWDTGPASESDAMTDTLTLFQEVRVFDKPLNTLAVCDDTFIDEIVTLPFCVSCDTNDKPPKRGNCTKNVHLLE
jgi:hypothetical protein